MPSVLKLALKTKCGIMFNMAVSGVCKLASFGKSDVADTCTSMSKLGCDLI